MAKAPKKATKKAKKETEDDGKTTKAVPPKSGSALSKDEY